MRKNFIPWNFSWRVSAETWDASCFKIGLLEKQQSVPNTCDISLLKKIFFQNLTDAFFIFQISVKYIKLVIPKILFILVLCNFNFYFKIMYPPFPLPPPPRPLPPPKWRKKSRLESRIFWIILNKSVCTRIAYLPIFIFSTLKLPAWTRSTGTAYWRMDQVNFLKAVFHKF